MLLTITIREAFDKGIWGRVCDLKGLNPWLLKEGLAADTDTISLTEDEGRALGLLPADRF